MFCTRCGLELEDSDLYCARCGNPVRPDLAPPQTTQRVGLSSPLEGKKIGGVCAGFARYMGVDVTLMRLIWLTLAVLTGGLFVVVYILAWIIMPRDPETQAREIVPVPERS